MLINHAVNPSNRLRFTTFVKGTRFFSNLLEFTHHSPKLQKTFLSQSRTSVSMGLPAFGSRTDKFNHTLIFALGNNSLRQVIAIGFVDNDSISNLHDAFLDALQVITSAGQYDQHEEVNHGTDSNLRLAYADGFYQNNITACSFAEKHSFAALTCNTAQSSLCRGRTDEAVRLTRKHLHTCFIT